MPIRATVYDAGQMPSGRAYTLFVDTNVWVDLVHPAAQPAVGTQRHQQFIVYSGCISAIRNGAGRLEYGSLALNELGHVIEKVEYKIWARGRQPRPHIKSFRRNVVERTRVIRLIRTAFRQVETLADDVPMGVDFAHSIGVVNRAVQDQHALDVYDMYLVEAAVNADAVLTDDSDFATVPGLRVVTANAAVLADAQAAGQLNPWPPLGQPL